MADTPPSAPTEPTTNDNAHTNQMDQAVPFNTEVKAGRYRDPVPRRLRHLPWAILRPTHTAAQRANRLAKSRLAKDDLPTEDGTLKSLRNLTDEQRSLAVTVLLTIYESDQNRLRGLESKALGVLTIVGLAAAVDLAGVALVLTARDTLGRGIQTVFWLLLGLSVVYLLFSLLSIYETIIPGERHVVSIESALPPEKAGVMARVATGLNRHAGIVRSNLVDAALRDTARGLTVALGALVTAVAAG